MTKEREGGVTPSLAAAPALCEQLALLSALSRQQLAVAEGALVQTLEVLEEAIARLQISFLEIHAVLQEQEEAQAGLATERTGPGPATVAAQYVDAAVTALQFQDISSQLLVDGRRRIQGVCALLAAALPAGLDSRTPAGLQQMVEQALAQQGAQLDSLPPSPIGRSGSGSGDIELF